MPKRQQQSGISLIEVLVTMFVMTVGLLGIAGLQATSVKDGLETAARSQAAWLVTEIVERARANPDGRVNGYNVNIDAANCANAPAMQCADTGAGNANNNCTANDMAAFDVWEVFCGNVEANVVANSRDGLNLTSIAAGCGAANCAPDSDLTVTITWIARTVNNSEILTDAQKAAQQTQTITMVVRP